MSKVLFQTYWRTAIRWGWSEKSPGSSSSLKYCWRRGCPLAWELGTLPLDQLDLHYIKGRRLSNYRQISHGGGGGGIKSLDFALSLNSLEETWSAETGSESGCELICSRLLLCWITLPEKKVIGLKSSYKTWILLSKKIIIHERVSYAALKPNYFKKQCSSSSFLLT